MGAVFFILGLKTGEKANFPLFGHKILEDVLLNFAAFVSKFKYYLDLRSTAQL